MLSYSLLEKCYRKTKEFTFNYVDRVRLAEGSLQDNKYPTRGSGWRHNKSISHLDLATSCHSTAAGINQWSNNRQLRHSRSLDYNHIGRSNDNFDIAEFYWRIDPETENYDENNVETETKSNLRAYETHYYRDSNYADEKNYHSTNSIYQKHTSATAAPHQIIDFGSESCSLRRSRSLAVIREETFSDLQINSANNSHRRSQLIPRARLVNRGFFRERER
ncbi:protein javelin [Teleopsis dalmanni]|uniref:protein javelin n=1 Tax=Teleopsis dalmanni TaxID=139649 RepID=UPI0018CDB799|nr:protein javelin [Teleopsis dalmanni]